MRKFRSYGPINEKLNYHVPRTSLIKQAQTQLLGEEPKEGGHYITVWGPRQRGKTWIMQKVMWHLQDDETYHWLDVVKLNVQDLKQVHDVDVAVNEIAIRLFSQLEKELPLSLQIPKALKDFHQIFTQQALDKPLILILDEFDALPTDVINSLTSVFRNIHVHRQDQGHKPTREKNYLLHGLALIGVRSVLGVDNESGSPFNVQRSVHIPNLTYAEVNELFRWYKRESGQIVEQDVIDLLYQELQGQPGLTSWFGELLTETCNFNPDQPIGLSEFQYAYVEARDIQPNSNITNLVKKAHHPEYRQVVLSLFQTKEKVAFTFDDDYLNFLYLNGIIDIDRTPKDAYVKFSSPFVQKRLFNSFSIKLFRNLGQLHDPFEDLSDTITETSLSIPHLIKRYEAYLKQNRAEVLDHAPRRTDLHVYEAIFHFHLYKYLTDFLHSKGGRVVPEFPTGNGQIDLIIHYADQTYGLEVKSFASAYEYNKALTQAANYAGQMKWPIIWLIFFVERIDERNRLKYEVTYHDSTTSVSVEPIFVETA